MRPRVIYRVFAASTVAATIVNIGVSWNVYTRAKSPVSYNVRVIEPPRPFDVSLVAPQTNGLPGPVESPGPSIPPVHVPQGRAYPFRYFEIGGMPGVHLNGRYYRVGDVHAFGIVSQIYPERIVFSSGDFIDNTSLNERTTNHDTVSSRSSSVAP